MSEQDITDRLRGEAWRFHRMHDTETQPWVSDAGWVAEDLTKAAAEIERLRAEVRRLTSAATDKPACWVNREMQLTQVPGLHGGKA